MTGEITLSGLVLPVVVVVGGAKEKVLAARRANIFRVVLPKENEKELLDLPDYVREEMTFIFAERIDDVLHAVIPELIRPNNFQFGNEGHMIRGNTG